MWLKVDGAVFTLRVGVNWRRCGWLYYLDRSFFTSYCTSNVSNTMWKERLDPAAVWQRMKEMWSSAAWLFCSPMNRPKCEWICFLDRSFFMPYCICNDTQTSCEKNDWTCGIRQRMTVEVGAGNFRFISALTREKFWSERGGIFCGFFARVDSPSKNTKTPPKTGRWGAVWMRLQGQNL